MAFSFILRIASLPNTSCGGVSCEVICNKDYMANTADERIHFKEVLLSKWICWIINAHIILPIVCCTLSTIVFASGFFVLMGLHNILQSFAIIVLNSTKSSLPLSTIIFLSKWYQVNQASYIWLKTRSALAFGTEWNYIQLLAGSITTIACK